MSFPYPIGVNPGGLGYHDPQILEWGLWGSRNIIVSYSVQELEMKTVTIVLKLNAIQKYL